MASNKYKSRRGSVITYILLILALVGIIGVIFRFTGGFTSDFSTFYVTVDGKDIMTASGGYTVSPSEPLTVGVKYAFSDKNAEKLDYSVKITPHKVENCDFDFTLDGFAYSFFEEEDLTAGFDIEYGEDSFTIKPKGGISTVMQSVYPDYTVGEIDGKEYEDMFTLTVFSYNGKASVDIYCSIAPWVEKISLNKTSIIL